MGYVEQYAEEGFPVVLEDTPASITERQLERLSVLAATVAGAARVARRDQREFRRAVFHLLRAWETWAEEGLNLTENWSQNLVWAKEGLGIITPEDAAELVVKGEALQLQDFGGEHARSVRTDIVAIASWAVATENGSVGNKYIQRLINEMNGVEYAMRGKKDVG